MNWLSIALMLSGSLTFAAAPCRDGDFKGCARACAAKSAESCRRLGLLYLEGKVVAADDRKGFASLKTGCELKDGESCVLAGLMAQRGRGTRPDLPTALALYDKGCAASHGGACFTLGSGHYSGEFGKDLSKAARFYGRACELSEAGACMNLGLMELTGDGIPATPEQGEQRLLAACDAGAAQGCTEAGIARLNGEVGGIKDPEAAKKLFVRACAAGEKRACSLGGGK